MAVNRLTEELEEVRNSRIKQALKKDEKFTPRPDHRLLLLIDEFPSLGKMPIFETAFAYIAGYGIKAYLITQDIEQIKDAYGNHESIISNCHIRIAYAPNKTETAEALSKMAGTTTILRAAVSYSGSRSSPLATNVSTNVDHISRPLITIDELMRLPGPVKEGQGEAQRIVSPGAMLIFIAGQSPRTPRSANAPPSDRQISSSRLNIMGTFSRRERCITPARPPRHEESFKAPNKLTRPICLTNPKQPSLLHRFQPRLPPLVHPEWIRTTDNGSTLLGHSPCRTTEVSRRQKPQSTTTKRLLPQMR
jgi:hypothetical protein